MSSLSVAEKLEFNKVLNYISKYAVTERGKDLIADLKPLASVEMAEEQGRFVEEAKQILIRQTPPPLEFIPELEETLHKSRIEGSVLDTKKIFSILVLATVSRTVLTFLKANSEIAPELTEKYSGLFVDKVFEHHIRKVVTETGDINENASPKLREIRQEINRKKDDLVKTVNRLIKKLSDEDIVREDYLTLRDGRIVIPVKVEHKRHIKGFIHSESSTGQTVYIEPAETLDLNNEIVSLSFAEKREIERILRELTKLIGRSSESLISSLQKLAEIDSVFSRAKYSLEIIGSFPTLNESDPFELKDARHPILLKKNGREATVPLNLILSDKRIIIITGPNAGGKTVVLKTLGLIILMVKSGIHIPSSPDSNLSFFKDILIDIGDEQSIEDDLSTFSSHLKNINRILNSVSSSSLVLLDEIGAGTDPHEGAAIATAVLLSLMNKKATVLATTHHGSLKIIANEVKGFENAAMEFDHEQLKPTYRFRQGIPGSSYAFEVARRIGFTDSFLETAKQHLDTDRHKLENFLAEIENKSQELREKLRSLELENSRLSGLSNLYQQKINKLEEEKKQILRKVKNEGEEYLKNINSRVERVIKEIKESNASSEAIKEAKTEISSIKSVNKLLVSEEPEQIADENVAMKEGDFVTIRNTSATGQIVEFTKDGKKALITSGKIKMLVSINELLPASRKERKEEVTYTQRNFSSASVNYRLDIRGQKPDSADFEVIKFLDDAYSSGMQRVEILHGKGTGALKKLVEDILKGHEKVNNYYFAPLEHGGDGITIVEFK